MNCDKLIDCTTVYSIRHRGRIISSETSQTVTSFKGKLEPDLGRGHKRTDQSSRVIFRQMNVCVQDHFRQ